MSLAAPFPYFGGKRRAAHIIWQRLGDPAGYVEPFAGSAAVLLARPRFNGRRVETLNDADGWLVNAWRAIRLAPDDVAAHAWGPVTEIDYHARLAWLQERRTSELVAWLEGDPEAYDARAAGWWLYVLACGIGDPFDAGPWRVIDGHLRELPHVGDAGQGINRKLPHLGDAGRASTARSPTSATPDGASTASSPTSATPEGASLPPTCIACPTGCPASASPAAGGPASSHRPLPGPAPAATGPVPSSSTRPMPQAATCTRTGTTRSHTTSATGAPPPTRRCG